MPLRRVEANGSLTPLLLGVVVDGGVDFGAGTSVSATHIRLHDTAVLGIAVLPPPQRVRLHAAHVLGFAVAPAPQRVRVHEMFVLGITSAPPPTHLRIHEASMTGVPV